jgi:hypothetical protein
MQPGVLRVAAVFHENLRSFLGFADLHQLRRGRMRFSNVNAQSALSVVRVQHINVRPFLRRHLRIVTFTVDCAGGGSAEGCRLHRNTLPHKDKTDPAFAVADLRDAIELPVRYRIRRNDTQAPAQRVSAVV